MSDCGPRCISVRGTPEGSLAGLSAFNRGKGGGGPWCMRIRCGPSAGRRLVVAAARNHEPSQTDADKNCRHRVVAQADTEVAGESTALADQRGCQLAGDLARREMLLQQDQFPIDLGTSRDDFLLKLIG